MQATALELRVERSLELLAPYLAAGCRVLDVGAGEGLLVERLVAMGYDASGMDASAEAVQVAREHGRNVVLGDFLAARDDARYDVLFFGGSLHHIDPLTDAVERAGALLAPGGRLVADDFDMYAADAATAAWFFDVHDVLAAFGLHEETHHHHDHHHERVELDAIADPVQRWLARHHHEPPLHGGAAMTAALSARFDDVTQATCPYLYWYALGALQARPDGRDIGERLLQLEQRLIEQRRIRAVGLQLVARA